MWGQITMSSSTRTREHIRYLARASMKKVILHTKKEMVFLHLGWRRHQEVSSPNLCLEQGRLWDQIRLFVVLCSQILKTSTYRLENQLGQSVWLPKETVLTKRKPFPSINSHSLTSGSVYYILFSSCTPLWRACLCLLNNLLAGAVRLPLGPLKLCHLQAE